MSFVFMRVRLTIIDETNQIVNPHFIMRAPNTTPLFTVGP